MLKPSPTSAALASSQRSLPDSAALVAAQAASRTSQDQQTVDGVVAIGDDADRGHGQEEGGEQAGAAAPGAGDEAVEHGDGEDAGEGFGQQDTDPGEAEGLGAGRLDPEAKGRLVDGDEAAGVERHKKP